MNINDLLVGKKIKDIRLIRGYGIVPARFEIEVESNNDNFIIDTEVNFRFIFSGKLMICFDDLFLDKNFEEISLKKYRSQYDIENTLLYFNIQRSYKKIVGKLIKKISITKFGDVNIYFSNKAKIQIVNDTHLNGSCILRVVDKNSFEEMEINNKKFMMPKKLFEIENYNGKIQTSCIYHAFYSPELNFISVDD